MQWFVLLAVALVFVALGKYLKPVDDIHAIAIYAAGSLSALWGFAMAPSSVLLGLGVFALGWLQVSFPRA